MLRDKLLSLLMPTLEWIQVEVTSFCNASCIYCPHTVYAGQWTSRHMPLQTFKRLVPELKHTRLVYLQGWGEPFLNPELFAMARLAKKAGCQVGTTTNGMLLHRATIAGVIESGMDIVAFSMTGDGDLNDAFRVGTRWETIRDAIRSLSQAKKKAGVDKPHIHIAYMLLSSGLGRLSGLPSLLAGLGVKQVVISTLDFVPSDSLGNESIRPGTQAQFQELVSRLEQLASTGRREGMDFHYLVPAPMERRLFCSERVLCSVFIGADGSLSPCVFTNIPAEAVEHWRGGLGETCHRIVFGNINERSLPAIWFDRPYRAFRDAFYTAAVPDACRGCPKLHVATGSHDVSDHSIQ